MPAEKVHDGAGEEVIAISGDHVPGAADVDEVDRGKSGEECVGSFLRDEVAHLAAHKQHGHAGVDDRLDGGVHAVDIRHFDWRKCRCAVDELRIPVPVPATASVAQVRAETIQVGRPGTVRVVLLDRVGDLVQRVESRRHAVVHEVMNSRRT
jgi:hypothetical protein